MKLILTLSILFAISFYASGQSKMNRSNYLKGKLAGKISLPEGTEIPEEGIYVYLLNEDKGVFTDQKGYYQFQDLRKKTLYHIRVMIFGYKSQEFAVVTSNFLYELCVDLSPTTIVIIIRLVIFLSSIIIFTSTMISTTYCFMN